MNSLPKLGVDNPKPNDDAAAVGAAAAMDGAAGVPNENEVVVAGAYTVKERKRC